MKKKVHPAYQEVLFIDSSTDFRFVCGSTLQSDEIMAFEGKEYPVCRVSISSASHPVFTGSSKFVDTEGRVDKFLKRYAQKPAEQQEKPKEEPQPKAPKKGGKKTK